MGTCNITHLHTYKSLTPVPTPHGHTINGLHIHPTAPIHSSCTEGGKRGSPAWPLGPGGFKCGLRPAGLGTQLIHGGDGGEVPPLRPSPGRQAPEGGRVAGGSIVPADRPQKSCLGWLGGSCLMRSGCRRHKTQGVTCGTSVLQKMDAQLQSEQRLAPGGSVARCHISISPAPPLP